MNLHTFPLTRETILAHAAGLAEGRAYGRLEGYEEARVLLAPIAEDLAYELYGHRLKAHETAEKVARLFEVHLSRTRTEVESDMAAQPRQAPLAA